MSGGVGNVASPVRVQLSRAKGWRMPPNTVSVARPGRYGNPHAVVLDDMRWDGETVDENDEPILTGPWLCKMQPDRISGWWLPTREAAIAKSIELFRFRATEPGINAYADLQARIPALRGKNLACWCKLGDPCHADVLLELANAPVGLTSQGATASGRGPLTDQETKR